MSPTTRREFLRAGIAAGAVAAAGLPLHAAARTATDTVVLGRSGVKTTRLAFGTGTNNGAVQAALGQKEFSRVVAYAYERGIRFFETAESYRTPAMLGVALKPFPRDSYVLMHKVTTDPGVDPQARFDEMRSLMGAEYFDIMLLHWQHTSTWPEDTKRWQAGMDEAQHKKTIVARGASVHGLPALRQVPGNGWLQVAMIRMNHKGASMDGPSYMDDRNPDHVDEVVSHIRQVHGEGMGVIGMKLVGNGMFASRADRQAAMRLAFQRAGTDCVTVGFKSTAEVDEAIENLNLALA